MDASVPSDISPLQPDSLSCVAEDASTLAAQQEHHHHNQQQHHHHHPDTTTTTPAQPLPPLQFAVENLESYTLSQQDNHGPRSSRPEEPYNSLLPCDESQAHVLSPTDQAQTYNSSNEVSIFSSKEDGYLRDLTSVLDPPDLDTWRERLFNVDEMIVLSEEQFRTYFPHVDNIYSHRSTQHYKRKPLVSHYWDCRLKGRPPGTPKSDDPNKKKRKRTARQRDLCDVKIKITEYFPGYGVMLGPEAVGAGVGVDTPLEALPGVSALFASQAPEQQSQPQSQSQSQSQSPQQQQQPGQPFGVLTPNPPLPEGHPGASGQRFFTIQRVNGNGANGKNDGVGGGHRHSLEESDRVKKNSVQRYLLKEAREHKKATGVSVS